MVVPHVHVRGPADGPMIVGTLVVTWTLVTMLDAAAGIDKHGAPLACARVGAER